MGVAAFVAAEMIPEANPTVRFACSLIISVTDMFSHLGFFINWMVWRSERVFA